MPKLDNIAAVIKREHDALAAETRIAQCPPFVAVNDIEEVARVPSSLRREHKATVNALAGARGAAFVVDCPSLESTALWVGTANNQYRDDYLCFLNTSALTA